MIHTDMRMIANGFSLLLGLELIPGQRARWQAPPPQPGFFDSYQELPICWASIPAAVEERFLPGLFFILCSTTWCFVLQYSQPESLQVT